MSQHATHHAMHHAEHASKFQLYKNRLHSAHSHSTFAHHGNRQCCHWDLKPVLQLCLFHLHITLVGRMWFLRPLGTAISKKLPWTNNYACKMRNSRMLFRPLTIGQGVQPPAGAIAFYLCKRDSVNLVRHRSPRRLTNEADKENQRFVFIFLS
jgi:hypothetical protein